MNVIDWLDSLYSKLPGFSKEIKDFIVRVLPYISIIIGILFALEATIELLGTPILSAFTRNGGETIFQSYLIDHILGLTMGILMIVAFRGLRRKSKNGWRLLFWSQMIFILGAILSFSPSFVLGFLFFYPLFQVRSNYR